MSEKRTFYAAELHYSGTHLITTSATGRETEKMFMLDSDLLYSRRHDKVTGRVGNTPAEATYRLLLELQGEVNKYETKLAYWKSREAAVLAWLEEHAND